jgi:hypothetical protein
MTIFEISVVDYHGGSLRVTAVNGRSRTTAMEVNDLVADEDKLRLCAPKSYVDYVEKVNLNRSIFLAKVHQIISESKTSTIAGVGAAAKANTLLTYYGLNNSYIKFVTDSSKHKIGKFTPFTRIPVFSDAEFANHGEITAIVLSWNIGDTLRANIRSINQNVRFLEL